MWELAARRLPSLGLTTQESAWRPLLEAAAAAPAGCVVEKHAEYAELMRECWAPGSAARPPFDAIYQRLLALLKQAEAAAEARESREARELADAAECIICTTRARTHLFVPCGHKLCCGRCADKVATGGTRKCPTCRCNISNVQRVYG